MERYGDAVLRSCFAYFRNRHDAEDAFQDTFVKFATTPVEFSDETHRKAWLLRVAGNICKDRLKAAAHKNVPLDDQAHQVSTGHCEQDEVNGRLHMKAALDALPEDMRVALVLSVVEGYTAQQIAETMGKPVNTVYS